MNKQGQIKKQSAKIKGLPKGYAGFLEEVKTSIRKSRQKASLSVNRELILLYWEIGSHVLQRQQMEGWGTKVIDHLSFDLKNTFPNMKGFSSRNIKYMRSFAESYPHIEFVQQVAAQIPWFHNCTIIDKIKNHNEREWYIKQTVDHGWSRNVLIHQIESGLYARKGKAVTNFKKTLPPLQSDLAQQTLKDPYVFDFLSMDEKFREKELEKALVEHLRDFLLELGVGFAYVGSQFHLEVGDKDFYMDMLFYHLKLRCYVVIELKSGEFKPEYTGKMNFYLAAVDDNLKTGQDNPTIGMILCKTKNRVIAEYALRDMSKPIGISEYKLTEALPEELKSSLPTVEALEAELMGDKKNEHL